VDANRELGLPDDCREYTSVKNILDDLGIKSIQLMTNNPRKVNTMACLGIKITKRIPCVIQCNEVNQVTPTVPLIPKLPSLLSSSMQLLPLSLRSRDISWPSRSA
jgi:hypothetical protein